MTESAATSARSGGLTIPRLRWAIVFCTFVISAVSYLDRNNLSIAAGSIKASFKLSDVQLGGVFSAFVFGYAIFQPIAGHVADRLGARRTVAAAIIWWGVFTALTPLVPPGVPHSVALLVAIRFLLGAGEAVIFPAGNRLVSSWIPSRERGLANGLIFAGVGVGGGLAPPLVTYLMVTYGWGSAFYASALLGVVVGLVWLVLVRDDPRRHPALSRDELALIEEGLPPLPPMQRRARWTEVLGDGQVLLLTGSYFCFGYVAYIFFSWFFLYLSAVRGLDLKSSAVLGTLPFVAMTVFSTLGGMAGDRMTAAWGKRIGRCGVAAGAMIVAAVFVIVATQVRDASLAALVLAGGAGSLYVAQSAYWTLSADFGGRSSGSLSSIMNMGAQFGGVVTASTTALIAHRYGWTASFAAAAAVAFVGGVGWLFIDPHHKLKTRDI